MLTVSPIFTVYLCYLSDGFIVAGVGLTPDAAARDAARWYERVVRDEPEAESQAALRAGRSGALAELITLRVDVPSRTPVDIIARMFNLNKVSSAVLAALLDTMIVRVAA